MNASNLSCLCHTGFVTFDNLIKCILAAVIFPTSSIRPTFLACLDVKICASAYNL